jgi:NADH-quinone oxidoreductase subunit N
MDIYSVNDLVDILPILFLLVWACVLLLVNVFTKRSGLTAILAALGLVVGLVLSTRQIGVEVSAFNDMLTIDGYAVFLHILIQGSGLLALALSYDYLKRMGWDQGEYYVLMLFSLTGAMLMATAANLIVVFLALEMLSIPLYVMAAIARDNVESEEAGLKYFLLGAFAGGFLLYGIALVYGASGETNLAAILAQVTAGGVGNQVMFLIGSALILIGLGFKVAVVPFHMWTPDVYQGAPTAVTAYMAVIAKAGGFSALLRIFIVAFPSLGARLEPVIWTVVAVTLVIGNLAAIAQKNIKRMFAYSSISHAGFMLMAFITFSNKGVYPDAVAAVLFYLLAFAVTSFGSWAVVIALEKAEGKGLELDDYAGLGRKYPALAVAMLIFLLSFAGVPPTLGFGGKFYVFRAVLEAGYLWLAVVGVLASLISAYYYLRVVIYMYFKDGEPETHSELTLNLVTLLTALGTVVLFFTAGPILQWAADSVLAIL